MSETMTKRRATQILIDAALRYCEGSGVGLRQVPSETQTREIVTAVQKLWPQTGRDYPLSRNFLSNYGIYGFTEAPDAHP